MKHFSAEEIWAEVEYNGGRNFPKEAIFILQTKTYCKHCKLELAYTSKGLCQFCDLELNSCM